MLFFDNFLTKINAKNILFQNIKILRGPLLAHQLPKSVAVAIGPKVAANVRSTGTPCWANVCMISELLATEGGPPVDQ